MWPTATPDLQTRISTRMQRIRLVLPAYNEENSLPQLLARADEFYTESGLNMDVLVVNDGSTDSTLDIAKTYDGNVKVGVEDLQPNRGLAGAIRAGLTEGIRGLEPDDIVVTMDADDSHNPALIADMVRELQNGADLAIASRYRKGSKVIGLSKFREMTSIGAKWMFQIMAPMRGVRDYTCGFRAYKVELIEKALDYYGEDLIEQQGFACMAEILLRLNRFKPVIAEVPMILRYDQKGGASKMKVGRTIRQTFGLLWQYRFSGKF